MGWAFCVPAAPILGSLISQPALSFGPERPLPGKEPGAGVGRKTFEVTEFLALLQHVPEPGLDSLSLTSLEVRVLPGAGLRFEPPSPHDVPWSESTPAR